MSKFVLTAQLQLQAPTNTKQVVDRLRRDLAGGVKVPVEVKGAKEAQRSIDNVTKSTKQAADAATNLGKSFGLAVKRFAAFTVASRAVSLFTNTLANAVEEAIDFERELIKISQVSGKSLRELSKLNRTIRDLSTSLGVSSKELLGVGRILAQAGIQARDLDVALTALAKTQLAPTFEDIEKTAEGAVAILAQFGEGVGALERQLGAINAVAGQFAVESGDLIGAIRRTGGVFKAAGGSLEEFLGIFTSVRATTRESAESIATGLRTIFTRIQRPRTIEFLKQLGVNLTDTEGKFVGPFEAVKRLSAELAKLEQGDLRFIRISEELGGFRQIGKVIPLLQQFETAERARQAAIEGGNSLTKDAETAQQALAVQITKVKEEFLELVAGITQTSSFQILVRGSLELAKALIQIGEAIKPLIPLLATLAAFKFAQGFGRFASGAGSAVRGLQNFDPTRRSQGGRIAAFARGGFVPGQGNRDTVPAMLTPGEFVIKKSSAQKLGAGTLQAMNENRFAGGGIIDRITKGKGVGAIGLKFGSTKDADGILDGSGTVAIGTRDSATGTVVGSLIKNKNLAGNSAGNKDLFNSRKKNAEGNTFASEALALVKELAGFPATRKVKVFGRTIPDPEKSDTPIEDQLKDFVTNDIQKSIGTAARLLGRAVKAPTRRQKAPQSIIDQIGIDSIAGKVLEGGISLLGGEPYDQKRAQSTNLAPFDFPKGIGDASGQIPALKALSILATDAKKTIKNTILSDIGSDKVGNSIAELINKSARFQNLKKEEKTFKPPKKGKKPQGRNKGGSIGGSGDTVPALLTPGEFVINKGAAQSIGYANLNSMNKTGVARFNKGGAVQTFRSGGSVSGGGAFAGLSQNLFGLQAGLAITQGAIEKFGDASLEASEAQFQATTIAKRTVAGFQQLAIVIFAAAQLRKSLTNVQQNAIKTEQQREKAANKAIKAQGKAAAKDEKQKEKEAKRAARVQDAKKTIKETRATAKEQEKQLRKKGGKTRLKFDGGKETVRGRAGSLLAKSSVGKKVVAAKDAEKQNAALRKRNAIDREYLQRTVKTGQGVKDLTKKQRAAYDSLQKNSAAIKENNRVIKKGKDALDKFSNEVDENNKRYREAKAIIEKANRSKKKESNETKKASQASDRNTRSKKNEAKATKDSNKSTKKAIANEKKLAAARKKGGRGGRGGIGGGGGGRGGAIGIGAGIGRALTGPLAVAASAGILAQQIGGGLQDTAQRRQEQAARRGDVGGSIAAARAGKAVEEATRLFTVGGLVDLFTGEGGGAGFAKRAKEAANVAAADAGVSVAVAATEKRLTESRKTQSFAGQGAEALVGKIGSDLSKASSAVATLPEGADKFKKQQELAAQATATAQLIGSQSVGQSVDELKAKLKGLSGTTTLTDNELERIARTSKAVAEAQKALNEAQIQNLQIQSVFSNAATSVDRFIASVQTGVSPLQGFIGTIKQAQNSLGVDATDAIDNVQQSLVKQLQDAGANQSTIDAVSAQGDIAKEVNRFQQSLGPTIRNLKLSTSPTAARAQLEGSLLQGVDLSSEQGRKIADVIRSKISSIDDKEFVGGTVDLSKVTGDINSALGGLTSGFNAAAEAQLAFQNKLTALYKQREQLEAKYAQTLNKAIDVQLEAAKIFEDAGGGKLTTDQQLDARIAQFNNIGGLAGVGLGSGSIQDIVRVGDQLGNVVRTQNQQRADALRLGGRGAAFTGAQGVVDDKTQEAKKANEALIQFTRQRIGLLKQELDLVKRKNAEEKKSLESLLSGDIEGFLKGQEAAGAAAALATGDRQLSSLFGAGALGAGFKTLQSQGLGADVEKRAAGVALNAFGISDPNAANVLAGTTPEEEAINAEIRAGAKALGDLAGQQAEFAKSDIAIQNATIEAANVQFNQELARSSARFSRGGTVYANRGMFVPRGTDTVPAMLTPGEFVVNRQAVQRGNNLQMLKAMNSNGGASAGTNLSGGGQVQYFNDGGIVSAITGAFTNVLPNLQSAFATFSEAVKNLNTTKLQVQVDPTVVTVNLAGTSFLGQMKQEIKDELLAEVGRQIGSSKTGNTGDNKTTTSVLNEIS